MNEKLNNGNTSTPYDDACRTLLTDCSKLVIPVVNEAFGTNHGETENVTLFNNEFFYTMPDSNQKERITDSNFAIGSARYHLECQSTPDGSIMWRVFEYDSQLALKDSDWDQTELTVRFPNTALIYLRHRNTTPDVMKMNITVPRDSCSYDVPILKVQNYSLEEIFEKRLFFILPFHLFTYEVNFAEYESNEGKRAELMQHYATLMQRLDVCVAAGELNVYEKNTIVAMMKKVKKHLLAKYSKLEEGLGVIMGGKVLDYEAKDILRQGEQSKLVSQIQKKLAKGKSVEEIAEDLEESAENIQVLIANLGLKT